EDSVGVPQRSLHALGDAARSEMPRLGAAPRPGDAHANPPPEERCRVPVRIGEMRVQHIEAPGALQALERAQDAEREEETFKPLEHTRKTEEPWMQHFDALLHLAPRHRWTVIGLDQPQDALQREP